MAVNKPKDFDTSIPWHDYTVSEIIARHFWVGETTGYQAVANAWAQIAAGKIDDLGLSVGFVESVGFLHALNTFGKNIHINGYGHKTNGGRQAYIDYRLLEQYGLDASRKSFIENGYANFVNVASPDALEDYKTTYAKEMDSVGLKGTSYLSSPKEHLVSGFIVSILCSEYMESLIGSLGQKYGLKYVYAFMYPPANLWKMEAPWCTEGADSPSTILSMVAMEDHHPLSGVLQVSAGSHLLELDKNRTTDLNTVEKIDDYLKYCYELAQMDVRNIYQYMPMAGDVLVWNGRCLYADAVPDRDKHISTRNSLIGVFEKVNVEEDKESLIAIPNKSNLFLIR